MEEEKKEHGTKMKRMEAEMEQVFEMKVKEKMQKLKDSEADVSNLRVLFVSFCRLYVDRESKCSHAHSCSVYVYMVFNNCVHSIMSTRHVGYVRRQHLFSHLNCIIPQIKSM